MPALLAILSAKGIRLSKDQENALRSAAADVAKVDTWLHRAVSATSLEEVLR